MTPSEREEIEKVAEDVCRIIWTRALDFKYGSAEADVELITNTILTQVAKARKEMLCEAVGWAYADYCISLDKGDDPRKQEMSSVLERAFTDLGIRNELNQKGE